MEPVDVQPATVAKPKKFIPTGPPKPRRDLRIIDGKPMIVEVIGDKITKIIGEKKNPYINIIKRSQDFQKEKESTSSLVPINDSISTLSAVETDKITDIKSGSEVTDVKKDEIKEKELIDTKKDEIKEKELIDTKKDEIKEKELIDTKKEISEIDRLAQERDKRLADMQIEFEERTKKKTKEDIPKKEEIKEKEQKVPKEDIPKKEEIKAAINYTVTGVDQAFLSGTGTILTEAVKGSAIEQKDIKKVEIEKPKPEAKPKFSGLTIKEKEDIKIEAKKSMEKVIESTKPIKEAKRMDDEKQREIDEELIAKGVEKKLKDINFKKSIDDAVKFAGESRTKLTDLHKEFDDIEEKVGTINKSVSEVCDGVDCIKKDFKTAQGRQTEFEKQVANGLQALVDKVQKLEEPSYICDNCGEDAIKALSSYCPNCGNPIPNWTGEDGHSVPGWRPYWLRLKEAMVH